MSLSRLRQILVDQINNKYLTFDNPPPADNKLTTRFASIFKHGGLTGRKRAELYRDNIIIKSVDNDDLLARRVLDDIKNEKYSDLDTSTDLRKRLLDGLVAFYVISDEDIDTKKAQLQRADADAARYAASAFAGAALIRDEKALRNDAKKLLVSLAIAKNTSENAPAAAIGNNLL